MDSARALITQGWKISLVSRTLQVSRAQLYALAKRKNNWKDERGRRPQDDNDALVYTMSLISCLRMAIAPSGQYYVGNLRMKVSQ